MSASPLKADNLHTISASPLSARTGLVRCSKKILFDHLVGASEQRGRHVDAEHLGGLQIDDELESGGLLHQQIGGLDAFDDATGIAANLAINVGEVGSVTHPGRRLPRIRVSYRLPGRHVASIASPVEHAGW